MFQWFMFRVGFFGQTRFEWFMFKWGSMVELGFSGLPFDMHMLHVLEIVSFYGPKL